MRAQLPHARHPDSAMDPRTLELLRQASKDYDHPQRKAIESVGPGQVLVMDCRGQGRAASAGGILATRLMKRGAAGLVTDGTLRDTPDIARLGLPVYAQGASPLTNL